MERLLQDIRAGIRSFRRDPGFVVTAVLILGLGIGLSTAVFTVSEALLLRRLPVRDQDRLVVLWGETRDRSVNNYPLTLADARAFALQRGALERVAFFASFGAGEIPVRDEGRVSLLRRSLVSGDFFDVIGTRPLLGRALRADDDLTGAAPVAVLSHAAWQRHYGGDPGVVGKRIVRHDDGVAYTIVGVMPLGLDYPRGTEFWAAVVPGLGGPGSGWDWSYVVLDLVGQLSPSATPERARDELTAFFLRPGTSTFQRELRGVVHTLPTIILGDTKPALIVFAVAAGLLLLITCLNVANLLVVRGVARMREMAVRSALGAGRRRVVQQLLTESTLLAIGGGVLGILVAVGTVRAFVAFAPPGVPRLDEIQFNATALAGAVSITGIAMLIFALAPAVMASRVELQQVLGGGSGTRHTASRRSRMMTEALVAGQVALALLVLSAAGLVARSLIKLERANLSLEPSHLLIATLAIRTDQSENKEKQHALLERLIPELAAVPGVIAASTAITTPFTEGWSGHPAAEGQSADDQVRNPALTIELVGPDYFKALGIPIERGRAFTAADRADAPAVVVLSKGAASYYWPGADPIGKRLTTSPGKGPWLTVVGIVPETRYRDLRETRPTIYFPLRQSFFPFAPMTLAIRTRGRPADLIPVIRRAIAGVDPGVALSSAEPFEALLDRPLAQPRLNALLLTIFAGAAVALASIGLFGVMATMVRQRTRELGVRMALGATSRALGRMVMRRGLVIASAGVVVGIVGALVANRLLAAMLYEVSPTDGLTLAAVSGALLSVALIASFIPARTSTRIDPVAALRAEG